MRFAGSPQVASFMADSVDHGLLGRKGQRARANEDIMATQSDAKVGMAQDKADALLQMAEIGADATQAAGQQAGQNSLMSGIMGGITGGIKGAGGLGSIFGGGGGGSSFTPTGGWGNFGKVF